MFYNALVATKNPTNIKIRLRKHDRHVYSVLKLNDRTLNDVVSLLLKLRQTCTYVLPAMIILFTVFNFVRVYEILIICRYFGTK